jgi:hypothetical protein
MKLAPLVLLLLATEAGATANYVYHEQTTALTGGMCGAYTADPSPDAGDPYGLRFKVEYQFYTNEVRVYYTTDGSTPSGAMGVASGTTTSVVASYDCVFSDAAGSVVDVAAASIPPQGAGTTVKYIIGAWHSGGGPEIFANSGTCTMASCANVFMYSIPGLAPDAGPPDAGAADATPAPADAAPPPDAPPPPADAAVADGGGTPADAEPPADAPPTPADAPPAPPDAPPGTPDAAAPAPDGATAPDAGQPQGDVGCGCRTSPRAPASPLLLLLLFVLVRGARRAAR